MWVRIPLETYIFILNFSLPPRSEQVNGAVANEIKHVHSPEVIVVLDPRYDLSYKALYISTCSIALSSPFFTHVLIDYHAHIFYTISKRLPLNFVTISNSESTTALPNDINSTRNKVTRGPCPILLLICLPHTCSDLKLNAVTLIKVTYFLCCNTLFSSI